MKSLIEQCAEIRAEIKKLGYNSRNVSVRHRYCGYSSSIDIKVKDYKIPIKPIKNIVGKYYSVDRCERTGEILEGGNTYTFVEYDYAAVDKAQQDYSEEARRIWDNILIQLKGSYGQDIKTKHGLIMYAYKDDHYGYLLSVQNEDKYDAKCYGRKTITCPEELAFNLATFDAHGHIGSRIH